MAPACIFVSSRTFSRNTIRTNSSLYFADVLQWLEIKLHVYNESLCNSLNVLRRQLLPVGQKSPSSIIWVLKILTLLVSVKYRFMFKPF